MKFRKKLMIIVMISTLLFMGIALVKSDDPKIGIKLDYKGGDHYDINEDGIETDKSVIDFSVENTVFNWNVDEEKLCTKWEILPVDDDKITGLCYGNEKCCNFINLAPTEQRWDDIFYLNYGEYGALLNNKVTARVIYVDYSLDVRNPYSEIYYSDFDYRYAVFLDDNYFDGEEIPDQNYPIIIKRLEKIKAKNQLAKVSLEDEHGNKVLNNVNTKKLNLRLYLENDDEGKDNDVIAITNFREEKLNWSNLGKISIKRKNNELEDYIRSKGLILRKVITVDGFDEATEDSYEGYIRLENKGIIYNDVLHCSDSRDCVKLKECKIITKDCYVRGKDALEIYLSHFSSVILVLNESYINLTLINPESGSILNSGENIYLNFTTNISLDANYSLDNNGLVYLGNSNLFTSKLHGSLDYDTLENGIHLISIRLMDNNSNIIDYNYSFEVDDIKAPRIRLTHNLSEANNSLIIGLNNTNKFLVQADEYAKVSYKLNKDAYTTSMDLGNDKLENIELTLEEGINNLLINATDLHNNNRIDYFTFNFSYSASCSDGIKNGDETGIDCGGSCDACIEFNVSTDKTVYELGEDILVTVLSRANSVVNLTVLLDGDVVENEIITGYSPDYPIYITTALDNINSPGEYIINAISNYMDNIEDKAVYFNVNPSSNILNVNINANATLIGEGETVRLSATVTGYSGSLTYRWDFGNDGSIDSYSSEVSRTYNTNGTYVVNLTVTDQSQTDSDLETIIVKKIFNATIIVKNNSGNIEADATVEFNNVEKTTSTEGKASFLVYSGSYSLEVRKEGYIDYLNSSITINDDKTIEINLSLDENDHKGPIVSILSPADKQTINDNSINIIYKVEDDSKVDCSLHVNEYKNWWIEKENRTDVQANTEHTFILSELANGSYKYRIKCTDKHGNPGYSSTRTLHINLAYNTEISEETEDIDFIISRIDELLLEFEKSDKSRYEVFDTLKIRESLDNSKTQLLRYKRDLNNLIWRKLNETELKEIEESILENVRKIKNEIPTNLEVIDSNEFVNYPKDDEIENITLTYLDLNKKEYSKKKKNAIVENIKELQSLITVTTKAKSTKMEYLSGLTEEITLIEKSIKTESNLKELVIVEYVPKKIEENASKIEFLFDYEVINEDPIIKVNLKDSDKFAYYIKKNINLDKIKETASIVFDEKNLKTDGEFSSITGFAIVDNIKHGFLKSNNKRIIIEVIAILVLVLVYACYSIKGTKLKYYFVDREALKNADKINSFIESAKEELQNNNYEKAKSEYKGMRDLFKKLPPDMKKETYNKIMVLSNKLDAFHINKLVIEATANINNKNKAKAVAIYKEINTIYKNIRPEYKSKVLGKCNELRTKISEKNAK